MEKLFLNVRDEKDINTSSIPAGDDPCTYLWDKNEHNVYCPVKRLDVEMVGREILVTKANRRRVEYLEMVKDFLAWEKGLEIITNELNIKHSLSVSILSDKVHIVINPKPDIYMSLPAKDISIGIRRQAIEINHNYYTITLFGSWMHMTGLKHTSDYNLNGYRLKVNDSIIL
jgi:hypothetical protein